MKKTITLCMLLMILTVSLADARSTGDPIGGEREVYVDFCGMSAEYPQARHLFVSCIYQIMASIPPSARGGWGWWN